LKASRLGSFLQIHGSGCGGANGLSYRSIDKDLVEREILLEHEASANQIRACVQDYPELGQEIMWNNLAYLLLCYAERVPVHNGPLGAKNRLPTSLRALAIDPHFVTLGAPIWLEKGGQGR
tara:strand:- start:119 stop:481 length:363 start_codon:yes stop_codon:yes gene_type:complete